MHTKLEKLEPWVVLIIVVSWLLAAWYFWFVCDDALISFRYGRNWAFGHGLRYNLIAGPPVEGYSNFLWVALAALSFKLGQLPEQVLPLLSLASGVGLIALAWRVARDRLGLGVEAGLWAACFTAFAPGVVMWGTSGLEALPLAFFLAALFDAWVLHRSPRAFAWGGFYALCLALIRTEGIGWVFVVVLFALALRPASDRRALLRALGVMLGLYTVYYLGRYAWFGTVFSNTATAKIHISPATLWRGFKYVVAFALADTGFVVSLVLAAIGMAVKPVKTGVALAAMSVGPAVYGILVGGDFMVMGRMILPGVVFAAWAGARLFEAAASASVGARLGLRGVGALVLVLHVLPLVNLHVTPQSWREAVNVRTNTSTYRTEYEQWLFQKDNTKRWTVAGLAVRQATKPGDSYVLGAIGAVGYASDLTIYDRYGLVSPEVANMTLDREKIHRSPGHDTFVPVEFFADQKPTILYLAQLNGEQGFKAAPKSAKKWRKYGKYGYAPTLTRVVVRDQVIWMLTLRYFGKGKPQKHAWKRFDDVSDDLRHGILPSDSPVIVPPRDVSADPPSVL